MEQTEIQSMIGRKKIDDNQNLWRELRALRDIYSEVHLLSQNISDLGTSFATSLAVSPPKKVPSLKVKKVVPHFDETSQSSPTSKSLSHRNNNGGVSPLGSFIEPFSADSYFDSIKPFLNLAEIEIVMDRILDGINSENQELEKEIRELQANVDDEVNYISPMNSNRSDASIDRTNGKHVEEIQSKFKFHDGLSVKVPGALRIRPEKGSGDISASLASLSINSSKKSSLDDGEIRQIAESRSSKVRGRLQAARDEKYFLDDDFF